MPLYGTTLRARRYTDGLGQLEPISAIAGAVSSIGGGIYSAIMANRQATDQRRAEKKSAKLVAAAKEKKDAADRKLTEDLAAQQTALALLDQQTQLKLSQAADVRSQRVQATVTGFIGPGMVVAILGLGLWFAFRGRG